MLEDRSCLSSEMSTLEVLNVMVDGYRPATMAVLSIMNIHFELIAELDKLGIRGRRLSELWYNYADEKPERLKELIQKLKNGTFSL